MQPTQYSGSLLNFTAPVATATVSAAPLAEPLAEPLATLLASGLVLSLSVVHVIWAYVKSLREPNGGDATQESSNQVIFSHFYIIFVDSDHPMNSFNLLRELSQAAKTP